jgi:hypothetical protein
MILDLLLKNVVAAILMTSPVGSPNADTASTNPATSVQTPAVQLSKSAYPEGVDDETAYEAWLDEHLENLTTRIDNTENTSARNLLRVATANWILATACEPPMSRMLQHLSTASDAQRVDHLAKRAEELLTEARAADGDTGNYRDAIDTLEAFAAALRVCAQGEPEDEARNAARKLSVYIEADDASTAAAARLWQAELYALAGKTKRAMRLLPLVTELPPKGASNYGFFTRLLRCRLLDDRGSHATAWSLLLILEESAREWFTTDAERDDAARTTNLAKFAICEHWKTGTKSIEAKTSWCDRSLQRLRDDYFSTGGTATVMRLKTAAPMIVAIPGPVEPSEDAEESNDDDAPSDETPQPEEESNEVKDAPEPQ